MKNNLMAQLDSLKASKDSGISLYLSNLKDIKDIQKSLNTVVDPYLASVREGHLGIVSPEYYRDFTSQGKVCNENERNKRMKWSIDMRGLLTMWLKSTECDSKGFRPYICWSVFINKLHLYCLVFRTINFSQIHEPFRQCRLQSST